MGGIGSGRKAKKKNTKEEFKPARKLKSEDEQAPKQRVFTVPAHAGKVKTSSGCRFPG